MTESRTGARRHVALFLLFLMSALNFLDRQLMAVLVEPIKAELHLTDTQIGLLTGVVFALFYATFAVPIAALADRVNRVRLIAVACLIWSLFSAGCGLATSFITLAITRIGVGIGEAGGTAPSLAVLSDYYPPHRRSLIFAIFTVSGAAGVFLSAWGGSWAAHQFGWRGAFFCVAAIGVVLAPALVLMAREPERGAADHPLPDTASSAQEAKPSVRAIGHLFLSNRSLRLLTVASGLTAFVDVALLSWTPAFLMRTQGMSMMKMGGWLGAATGLSMAAGLLIGGLLVNKLAVRSPRSYALVPGVSMLLAAPVIAAALLVGDGWLTLLLMSLPMTLGYVYTGPALALAQNLAPPRMRATTASILMLAINLFGGGCGPLFVGIMSDVIVSQQAGESLRIAMLWLLLPCLGASAAFYALSRTLRTVLPDIGARASAPATAAAGIS